MGEVFLDAFVDTLKVLPFLLIMNFLIELLEYKSDGLNARRILKGGLAPLIGTGVGVVPQCGFSVVATELYAKRKIALGTLLAVYIATSDEALPIMLSSYAGVTKLLTVLIIKVCFALIVGYAAFAVEKLAAKNSRSKHENAQTCAQYTTTKIETHEHAQEREAEHAHGNDDAQEAENAHGHKHEHGEGRVHIHGCHRHDLCGEEYAEPDEHATRAQKAKFVWNRYLKHPLTHTATVILYILIVNIAFEITVYYVGERRLAEFIGATGYLQPVLAAAVGLIPNCAASVILTELYVVGGLNLGGAVAGLCVGAGIGYAVLVKQNRPVKNTLMIIAVMFVLSASLGVAITTCGF